MKKITLILALLGTVFITAFFVNQEGGLRGMGGMMHNSLSQKNQIFFQDKNQVKNSGEKEYFSENIKYGLETENFSAYSLEEPQKGETIEYFLETKKSSWKFSDLQPEEQKTKLWLYNDELAPVLKVKKGQTLKVTLKNSLDQETTIHWHGVRLPNKMDGVPALTQDAVKNGEEFIYEFTPKDAGTFWFHPHVRGSEQLGMGLYGVLIVEENEESELYREYSQEIVWAIDDWRIDNNSQIYQNFGSMHDTMMDGRWGNIITVNGKAQNSFDAKRGERIRIRIANTSNARTYRLNFSDLNPKVIAVDGMNVKKAFDLKKFDLAPGNRIDLDIKIPKDFSEKEVLVTDSFTQQKNIITKIKILDEVDEDVYDFSYPENKDIPSWEEFSGKEVDALYTLDFTGMMMNGNWTINGKTYEDDEPFVFEKNKLYKIRFKNTSVNLHPMHIHGQFFKVISKNGKVYKENFFRDTVLIYPEDTVDVVMLASDEGQWMNHCHIQEHAENGMMTSIIVK